MADTFVLTREIAQKVLTTVDAGLSAGLGKPIPGQMCVEAAVCFALGLPHSDDPGCVSPAVRSLKITLNDSYWSSKAARARGMRRLAIVQLGTKGTIDEGSFAKRVAALTIRTVVPVALRAAATLIPAHAVALEAAAQRCEVEGTQAASDAARAASDAASDAARAARAARAASDAARAASDAARAASDAASDAARAARAASYAASYAARAARAASYAASDNVLASFAEEVVKLLAEMGAPGAAYLDLAPL